MERPLRKSSEAPEVVLHSDGDQKTIWTYAERLKRSGHGTLHGKQIDMNDTESTKYPPTTVGTPSLAPPPSPIPTTLFTVDEDDRSIAPRRISFGILETIVLVLVAFLIGGGIGGGIGGALFVKEKSRCSADSTPTSAPAPERTGNTIVDPAGCPAINSTTWKSATTGKTFRRVCYRDAISQNTQNIITGNTSVSTIDACLEACATSTGCVAATWYIFSVTSPSKNAVCFFKNQVGLSVSQPTGDSLVTAYLE
ncbi:hypothetical protein GLAREA_12206 [Glarea lozoyensis ATCC 20868]|uniref:Apple domain-containing protein n=1 Tax=Glarea lozoyensis (strain ATCC 20868 / MF5171) TaxID=1116229 RepID=S3D4U1_GLAL2|nr:uncharacterized protein GLAREA_12206 [Glarea lozoyensis ATCC 20868]EPE32124.1 hypothetical protein GLAREA_12206 [Glarea lozoyensis ATCC 20868]